MRRIARVARILTVLTCLLLIFGIGGVFGQWFYEGEKYKETNLPVRLVMPQPDVPVIINNASDQFENIISTQETLASLLDRMDTTASSSWSGRDDDSFIGNVEGASAEDKNLLTELFGEENLQMEIDGVKQNISLMVKRENLDGNADTGANPTKEDTKVEKGSEMVMYYTNEDLDTRYGATVTVYAIVFSKDISATEWKQVGTIFTGTATVTSYSGWYGTGSFNTDNWRQKDTDKTLSAVVTEFLGT